MRGPGARSLNDALGRDVGSGQCGTRLDFVILTRCKTIVWVTQCQSGTRFAGG